MKTKKSLYLSLIAIVALLSVGFWSIYDSQDSELIILFKKSYNETREKSEGRLRSEAITKFILACCENKDDLIKTLSESGFELEIISEIEKIEELNQHYLPSQKREKSRNSDYVVKKFDEAIFARRKAVILDNFKLSRVRFDVVMLLNDDEVSLILSNIER